VVRSHSRLPIYRPSLQDSSCGQGLRQAALCGKFTLESRMLKFPGGPIGIASHLEAIF